MLVSHDRHLLRLVSDSLWFVADGQATPFAGDIDDYGRWLSERHAVHAPGERQADGPTTAMSAAARRGQRRREAEERRRVAPLRRKIETLEQRLGALSNERASIESTLAGVAIYGENERSHLHELLLRRGKLDAEISTVESAWIETSEQLDAMGASEDGASRGVQ